MVQDEALQVCKSGVVVLIIKNEKSDWGNREAREAETVTASDDSKCLELLNRHSCASWLNRGSH